MDVSKRHKRQIREYLAKPPFNYRDLSKEEINIFSTALVHDSYSNEIEGVSNYERLEFLGDAVLEFIACEHIFKNTDLSEGKMTNAKQDIVSNHIISEAVLVSDIEFDALMLVGGGHVDPVTKRPIINETMRSDAFEALLAAIYLVKGIDHARKIVRHVLIPSQTRI
ncbi:MAG TPA: ribonuclease III domain-containing protein [Candidatus Methanomethylophilaceae archaeon]|nr:ribonuclease III domain-containing protein [Candidatus Methanomethylophilaceae archaeon]